MTSCLLRFCMKWYGVEVGVCVVGGGEGVLGLNIKGKNLLLAIPSFSSWPPI